MRRSPCMALTTGRLLKGEVVAVKFNGSGNRKSWMGHRVAGGQESLKDARDISKRGSLRLECKLPPSRSTRGCNLARTQVTERRVVFMKLSNTGVEVRTAAM